MTIHELDRFDDEAATRRLFTDLDRRITDLNRTHIREEAGTITEERIIALAKVVSRLRARYLQAALTLGEAASAELDSTVVEQLHRRRAAYEEALHAFGALRHAIKRGYFKT
ncbi:MAG: hypothetical protein H6983_20615 [Ectothiorhodospiraceae bacterium]|nr:hypothetical protein [Ectothiorhodospiraceae bacterium]